MSQWGPSGDGGYGPAEEVETTVDIYRRVAPPQQPTKSVWQFNQSAAGDVQIYSGNADAYARQLPSAAQPMGQQGVYGGRLFDGNFMLK